MMMPKPYEYQGPYRKDALKKVADWPETAQQLHLARTGAERHAARVLATKQAASRWVTTGTHPTYEEAEREEAALAAALLVLDLRSKHSQRMQWASKLGTGRWQANDGGAWKAAAEDALLELMVRGGAKEVEHLISGRSLTFKGVLKLGMDILQSQEHILLYRVVRDELLYCLGREEHGLEDARAWDYTLKALVSWDMPAEEHHAWLGNVLPSWGEWVEKKMPTDVLDAVRRGELVVANRG